MPRDRARVRDSGTAPAAGGPPATSSLLLVLMIVAALSVVLNLVLIVSR